MKLLLPFSPRYITLTAALLVTAALTISFIYDPGLTNDLAIPLAAFGVLSLIGVRDLFRTKHSILRNYPIAAHIRFLLENFRPEMRQYFFEGDKDGAPFPRDKRAIVYQRAKKVPGKRPFGTEYNVYETRHEWLHHSIAPKEPCKEPFRITIGGSACSQRYSASVFNISAMSYGALSANAIRALNKGARGGICRNTAILGRWRARKASCLIANGCTIRFRSLPNKPGGKTRLSAALTASEVPGLAFRGCHFDIGEILNRAGEAAASARRSLEEVT